MHPPTNYLFLFIRDHGAKLLSTASTERRDQNFIETDTKTIAWLWLRLFFETDTDTTWFLLLLPVPKHKVTKNLAGHRIHLEGPQIYQMNCQINSFQNMCDMLKAKVDRLARKIEFVQKEHLKTGSFGEHESGLPDFGRPWTPNGWHQVNFWGTPEHLGVWRLKLAMWKVGGTKMSVHEPKG